MVKKNTASYYNCFCNCNQCACIAKTNWWPLNPFFSHSSNSFASKNKLTMSENFLLILSEILTFLKNQIFDKKKKDLENML